jgi:hypothetical protein
MTDTSIADYSSEMRGFTKIEPASGVALDTRAQNMASAFTWNCNPLLDSTCGLLASAYNSSDPLCYVFGTGTQMPCSNANVFTPRVRGGKVLPIFWSRANLKPDGVTEIFLEAIDTRHALAIMSLVSPLLFLLVLVLLLPGMLSGSAKVSTYTPSGGGGGGGDVETAKLVQADADANAKHDASDDVIPLG